mgnify:FL=1
MFLLIKLLMIKIKPKSLECEDSGAFGLLLHYFISDKTLWLLVKSFSQAFKSF